MRQVIFICCIPILLFIEFLVFGSISDMLTMQNDISVFFGVLMICADLFLNYLLVTFIIKQLKSK